MPPISDPTGPSGTPPPPPLEPTTTTDPAVPIFFPLEPPDAPPPGRSPERTKSWWLSLTGVIVVLTALGAAIVLFTEGSGAEVGPRQVVAENPVSLPDNVGSRFEIELGELPGRKSRLISGEFGRFDAAVDGRIVQFDETGQRRWSTALPEDWEVTSLLPVIDGRLPVVMSHRSSQAVKTIFLADDSGEITDTEIAQGSTGVYADRFYAFPNFVSDRVELYDVQSGRVIASIDGSPYLNREDGVFFVTDGTTASVYDLDLAPLVTDVEVDSGAGLRYDDHQIITVAGDRVVAYDADGEAWSTETDLGELDLVQPLGDDRWLLQSSYGVAIFTGLRNGSVDEVWRSPDTYRPVEVRDDRTVLKRLPEWLLVDSGGEILYSNENTVKVVGFTDGVIFIVRDSERWAALGVDFDGNEMWSIPIDSFWWFWPASDAIFDPATGTVYGPD